jgi:hypothetical protein
MHYYHGKNKKKSYFEGWYFKLYSSAGSIALIPGINIDNTGKKQAFIQVNTEDASYQVPYDYRQFYALENTLSITVDKNYFSGDGIRLDIHSATLQCTGEIAFSDLLPVQSPVMGPFRFIPFMECNHEVLSLSHKLRGQLTINSKVMDLTGGIGYIEKDFGHSFPKQYLWLQCNSFTNSNTCFMISIAKIPFLGTVFTGCIGIIHCQGREYRLATYYYAKVRVWNDHELIIHQGEYQLHIHVYHHSNNGLLAPKKGSMSKEIRENLCCSADFEFRKQGDIVFKDTSHSVSFEYVEPN